MPLDDGMSPEIRSLALAPEHAGMRFDAALARAVPDLSRLRLAL